MVSMKLPSRKDCFDLIKEMGMLEHIVSHSQQVSRVAVYLSGKLMRSGIDLNVDLVRTAALLHDITKTRSFKTRENHAQTGAELLRERGFESVAEIVAQHVRLDHYFAAKNPSEAEVVNYADKRVLHDQIVSLEERMNYILDKYADGLDNRLRIKEMWTRTQELEKRLFRYLSFRPDALKNELEKNGVGIKG